MKRKHVLLTRKTQPLLGGNGANHLLSTPSLHVPTLGGAIPEGPLLADTPLASIKAHSAVARHCSAATQLCPNTVMYLYYPKRPRGISLTKEVYAMPSRCDSLEGAVSSRLGVF